MTSVIQKVAADAGIPRVAADELAAMAGLIDSVTDCLGFCMSRDGDTLSQWRGYADDGKGVSIGFSESFLHDLIKGNRQIQLHKVIYNLDEQKQRVREIFPEVTQLISEGAVSFPLPGSLLFPKSKEELQKEMDGYRAKNAKLFGVLTQLQHVWFSFKNPAFREENEWRIGMNIMPGFETEYRTSNGRLMPFMPLSFPPISTPSNAIEQIILGPKNTTPIPVIEQFLRRFGMEGVSVVLSESSYR